MEVSVIVEETHEPYTLGILSLAHLASLSSSLNNECIGVLGVQDGAETIEKVSRVLESTDGLVELGIVVGVFVEEGLLEEFAEGLVATPP